METLNQEETFRDLNFVINGFASMSHNLTQNWPERAFLKAQVPKCAPDLQTSPPVMQNLA